jgi:hypothetical protein
MIVQRALDRFYEDKAPDSIPESLPLVEEFCEKKLSREAFAGIDVLFIQHHLGPLVPRVSAMRRCGLDASRCWFVDIPYSTHNRVRDELERMGCPKDQMVTPFDDPIAPYSRRQLERVESLISTLAAQGHSRILVIDDGAYFVRTLDYMLPRNKGLVMLFKERGTFLVEQTTRGHCYLEEAQEAKEMLKLLGMPVVSIARTNTKYALESPFIGAAVSRGMIRTLSESGRLTKGLGNVLVIGFGAVGMATTRELSKLQLHDSIDVYDIKWKTLKKSIEDVGANPLRTFPEHGSYDTVLGCTGHAAIHTVKQMGILAENAVLASGSSAAIEFNREKFIDLAYKRDDDNFFVVEPEKTRNAGIHATIGMQLGDKRFSFLNAGFPVDFDGRVECVPHLLIQLTHGMLVAAANETLAKPPGFHRLNMQDDNWFFNEGLKWVKSYSDQ